MIEIRPLGGVSAPMIKKHLLFRLSALSYASWQSLSSYDRIQASWQSFSSYDQKSPLGSDYQLYHMPLGRVSAPKSTITPLGGKSSFHKIRQTKPSMIRDGCMSPKINHIWVIVIHDHLVDGYGPQSCSFLLQVITRAHGAYQHQLGGNVKNII